MILCGDGLMAVSAFIPAHTRSGAQWALPETEVYSVRINIWKEGFLNG